MLAKEAGADRTIDRADCEIGWSRCWQQDVDVEDEEPSDGNLTEYATVTFDDSARMCAGPVYVSATVYLRNRTRLTPIDTECPCPGVKPRFQGALASIRPSPSYQEILPILAAPAQDRKHAHHRARYVVRGMHPTQLTRFGAAGYNG
jgi:hypothetical protein